MRHKLTSREREIVFITIIVIKQEANSNSVHIKISVNPRQYCGTKVKYFTAVFVPGVHSFCFDLFWKVKTKKHLHLQQGFYANFKNAFTVFEGKWFSQSSFY